MIVAIIIAFMSKQAERKKYVYHYYCDRCFMFGDDAIEFKTPSKNQEKKIMLNKGDKVTSVLGKL
jgi:hypothetical protein